MIIGWKSCQPELVEWGWKEGYNTRRIMASWGSDIHMDGDVLFQEKQLMETKRGRERVWEKWRVKEKEREMRGIRLERGRETSSWCTPGSHLPTSHSDTLLLFLLLSLPLSLNHSGRGVTLVWSMKINSTAIDSLTLICNGFWSSIATVFLL